MERLSSPFPGYPPSAFHCSHCGSIHVAGDCALEAPVATAGFDDHGTHPDTADGTSADDDADEVPVHEFKILDRAGRVRVLFTSISDNLPMFPVCQALLEAMPMMESAFMVGDRSGPCLLVGVPRNRTSPLEIGFIQQCIVDAIEARGDKPGELRGEPRGEARDAREVG